MPWTFEGYETVIPDRVYSKKGYVIADLYCKGIKSQVPVRNIVLASRLLQPSEEKVIDYFFRKIGELKQRDPRDCFEARLKTAAGSMIDLIDDHQDMIRKLIHEDIELPHGMPNDLKLKFDYAAVPEIIFEMNRSARGFGTEKFYRMVLNNHHADKQSFSLRSVMLLYNGSLPAIEDVEACVRLGVIQSRYVDFNPETIDHEKAKQDIIVPLYMSPPSMCDVDNFFDETELSIQASLEKPIEHFRKTHEMMEVLSEGIEQIIREVAASEPGSAEPHKDPSKNSPSDAFGPGFWNFSDGRNQFNN